jgi:hypothetical protein
MGSIRMSPAHYRQTNPPGPLQALRRVSEHGYLTQRGRIAARRHAEHPPVLATELRRAVVAYRGASTGDVLWLGDETACTSASSTWTVSTDLAVPRSGSPADVMREASVVAGVYGAQLPDIDDPRAQAVRLTTTGS